MRAAQSGRKPPSQGSKNLLLSEEKSSEKDFIPGRPRLLAPRE
jgi:hypothetical protein